MGIVHSIVLILLGVLGMEAFISAKIPAARDYIAKLYIYREIIGLLGIVLGLFGLIAWISVLHYFRAVPFYGLLALLSSLVMLALGIVFGLDFIRNQLREPNSVFLMKLDIVRIKLLPYQNALGASAIILGVISLF